MSTPKITDRNDLSIFYEQQRLLQTQCPIRGPQTKEKQNEILMSLNFLLVLSSKLEARLYKD